MCCEKCSEARKVQQKVTWLLLLPVTGGVAAAIFSANPFSAV